MSEIRQKQEVDDIVMLPLASASSRRNEAMQPYLLLLLWVCLSSIVQGHRLALGPRSLKSSDGQPRIVGGEQAPSNRYPYIASLKSFSSHSCGASLIAPELVLTAAHCQGEAQQIQLNPHRLSSPLPESELFANVQEFVHPLYQSLTEDSHDIMVIKMNGKSVFSPIRVNSLDTLPGEGGQLRTMGWGSLSSEGSSPDVLQYVDLTYIDNEECVRVSTQGAGFGTYSGKITDDMMCALEPNKDSCQGDSGGPLIIAGTDGASDVQVGIVSWGYGCAKENYAGVYARTSYEWNWLRVIVCNNSDDPPADYRCDEGGATFSPRPTSTPTAPTASPAPSGKVNDVLVKIVLDSYTSETGFRIKDADGDIVFEQKPGSYTSRFEVYETISLSSDAEFILTILDSFGDGFFGLFTVFLDDEEDNDKILAYYDGSEDFSFATEKDIPFGVGEEFIISIFPSGAPVFPSSLPSAEPSAPTTSPAPTSPEALILLRIVLDLWPHETGWRIENSDGGLVIEVPAGTYKVAQAIISEELILLPEQQYNLTLFDTHGDGFQGEASIFLDIDTDENLLAYFNASFASFSSELVIPFLTSSDGVIQVFPTMTPTTPTGTPSTEPSAPTTSPAPSSKLVDIVISLTTDNFPREVGWSIEDDNGELVYFVEPNAYTEAFFTYNETIALPENQEFIFTIMDSFGDGFDGEIIVYLGDPPAIGNIILYFDEESSGGPAFFSISQSFISSENATIPVFPTPPTPTSPPSDAPPSPSVSLAPSGISIAVTIVINLDSFPRETGFTIEGPLGEVVYEVSTGSYVTPSLVETELVMLPRDQTYTLNILDSYGDGFEGTLYVYLGEPQDLSEVLGYYEGPQGRFTNYPLTFTAAEFVFATAEPTAPTSLPSGAPSSPSISPAETKVAVILQLDSFPDETGWRIETLDGTVIAEVLNVNIGISLDDDNAVELESGVSDARLHKQGEVALRSGSFTSVEIVALEKDTDYNFVLTDTFGDGFNGQAMVYLGEIPDEDKALVYHDGLSASGYAQTYPFITGVAGVLDIVVTPPSEIQLSLAVDFPPSSLQWILFDDKTGSVLAQKGAFESIDSPVSVSFFHSGPAKPLSLYIYQSGEVLDGSYSISHDGQIIAMGDQNLGTSRFHYFDVGSTGSRIPITAFAKQVEYVSYPLFSWDWVQFDGSHYADSFTKALEADGSMAATRFIPAGGLFKMFVNNYTNFVGLHHMTVGSVDPFKGRILPPNQFKYTFVSEENYERPPTVESDAAHLVLEISFGNIDPASIGWILYAGREQTAPVAESRQASIESLDGFDIYTFGPEAPYPSSLIESTSSEMIPLPLNKTNNAQEFAFVLYHEQGWGSDRISLLYKLYDGEREVAVGKLTRLTTFNKFTINEPLVAQHQGNTTMGPAPAPSSSGTARAKLWAIFSVVVTLTLVA